MLDWKLMARNTSFFKVCFFSGASRLCWLLFSPLQPIATAWGVEDLGNKDSSPSIHSFIILSSIQYNYIDTCQEEDGFCGIAEILWTRQMIFSRCVHVKRVKGNQIFTKMFRKEALQSNHPCFHKMNLRAQMKEVGGHSYHMAMDSRLSLSERSDVSKYQKSPQRTSLANS